MSESGPLSGLSIADLGTRGKVTFIDVTIFSGALLVAMRPSNRDLKRVPLFWLTGVAAITQGDGGPVTTASGVFSVPARVRKVGVTFTPRISSRGQTL